MNTKTYLGDSVYVDIEDDMVILTTDNGYPDDPRNVIYLEPAVLAALMDYCDRANWQRTSRDETKSDI